MILTEPQIRDEALAVIRRLQGQGAYANLDSGPRFALMYTWACANTESTTTFDRALAQAFVTKATEMLSEWEAALGIPDGTNRFTALERQTRLAAYKKASSFTEAAITAALDSIDYDALRTATAEGVGFDLAEDGNAQAMVLDMTSDGYDDATQKELAAGILARTLPAKRYGFHNKQSMRNMLVRTVDPKWDGDEVFGETAIRNPTALDVSTVQLPPARIVSYGPLTPLHAEDLNAIQRAVLMGPADGDVHASTPDAWGGIKMQFSFSVASGGTATIDDANDWRDRTILAFFRYKNVADIRPQSAGATGYNANGVYGEVFFYAGLGGLTYDGTADWLQFYADAATGELKVDSSHGSNTTYGAGLIFTTPDLGMR